METVIVASDDQTPEIQEVLGNALDGIPDSVLVETIGNVTSQRIARQLKDAGYDVECRDLDFVVDTIAERCRVGSDFSAIVLSTLRPYKGMNEKLKSVARNIRGIDDSVCLSSGVRVKHIPIVIALSLEMAGLIGAPTEGQFDLDIPWCTVRRPGAAFGPEVDAVVMSWRREVYLQLDYAGFALGFNERGELDISPVLQRKRRESQFFNESASPSSLQRGGLVLVPEVVEERMQTLLELREICGNLENVATRQRKKPEHVIHEFLDHHPEVLYRDYFVHHWSEKLLADKSRPDFILAPRMDSADSRNWEVLELKRPDEVVMRKNEFSRAVVKGLEQLRRYEKALKTGESIQRQRAALGTSLASPRLCLLIGRSFDPEFSQELREVHASSEFNDISILLYDELANPLWRRVVAIKQRLLGQKSEL